MDISRVISIVRTLKEQPTNSAGENGFTNAANAAGPTAGYDKRLFPAAIDDLSQDYQSPGQTVVVALKISSVGAFCVEFWLWSCKNWNLGPNVVYVILGTASIH